MSAHGITGYRLLTEQDKAAMNEIKALENQLGKLLRNKGNDPALMRRAVETLQVGFMLAVRSIAMPESDLKPIG